MVLSLPTLAAAAPSQRPVVATSAGQRAKRVEVEWSGSWWPATVMQTRGKLTRIHYTGWGAEWDEWVGPERVRSAAVRPPVRSPRPGQRVEVEWHGSWWPATVIQARAGLTKIHYTGWGAEWDEWIEPPRLRAAHPQARIAR